MIGWLDALAGSMPPPGRDAASDAGSPLAQSNLLLFTFEVSCILYGAVEHLERRGSWCRGGQCIVIGGRQVYLGKWHGCDAAVKCLNPGLFFGGGDVSNHAAVADLLKEADMLGRSPFAAAPHPSLVPGHPGTSLRTPSCVPLLSLTTHRGQLARGLDLLGYMMQWELFDWAAALETGGLCG